MTGFFTAIYLSSIILAHSWYDPWCCNDKDCRPVPCTELIEQNNGDLEYKGYIIPKDKIKPSQDKDCHVCIFLEQGRCAYVHQGV